VGIFRSFDIEDGPEGRVLTVTGRWSAKIDEALASKQAERLQLNYTAGFRERDLEFIREDWPLKELLLLDGSIDDLSPIGRLGGTLETLTISEAGPRTTVELGDLPHLRRLAAGWRHVEGSLRRGRGEKLRDLWVEGYDGSDLTDLGHMGQLEDLELLSPRHLVALRGVENLSSLASLEIARAPKLVDLSALVAVRETLTALRLETCKTISSLEEVGRLEGLRELWVANCGDIESFEPLRALRGLEVLWAWESTKVLDGDLSPLEDLPRLRELRMQERRSYTPQVSDVQAELCQHDRS
jgi:internalin A